MAKEGPKTKHEGVARRRWRQVFRRTRIYIPFTLLVLLALALFLPLSPDWLKRIAEDRIYQETGVAISIQKLRVHLAFGQVDLFGISIPGETDQPPFTIDEVRLSGSFAELVAGDGRWPNSVAVINPSEMRLLEDDDKIEPVGPLKSLFEAISIAQARFAKEDDEEDADPFDFDSLYLPTVRLQNVVLGIGSTQGKIPTSTINLSTVQVAERLGMMDRIEIDYSGTATIVTAESISGTLFINPASQSGRLETYVTGMRGDFNIDGFGELGIDARNVLFGLGVVALPDGEFQVDLSAMTNRFELEERRVGGERWVDRDLEISIGTRISPRMDRLSGFRVSLVGQETDLRLTGTLDLNEDLDGIARLQVYAIPSALISLARREAAIEGVIIDPLDNRRLRADLELFGPFATPGKLEGVGSIELSNWEVSQTGWPAPLVIRNAAGLLSRDGINLSTIDVALGDLIGRGNATLPLDFDEPGDTLLTFEASLRGPPGEGLVFARHFGVLPGEINSIDTSLTFDVSGALPVRYENGAYRIDDNLGGIEAGGRLSWTEGEADLRDLPDPLRFASGALSFDQTSAALQNLRVFYQDLSLNVDLALENQGGLILGNPDATLRLGVGGSIPSFLNLAERLVPGLFLPSDIEGRIELNATANTTLPDWENADYQVSFSLNEASGVIPLPDGPVALSRTRADIRVTPDEVRLDRLLTRVADLADISLTGTVNDDLIEISFNGNADLGVVFAVAPTEVNDLVMEGRGRASGTARLVPAEPLEPGPDVVRRWIDTIAGPNARAIDIEEDSPLRVELEGQVVPEGAVSIFHRDFPQPVRNIRGHATVNERGFEFQNIRADLGSARNVLVNEGHVYLGILGRRVEIMFDADLPEIDVNEWMEGWESAEWAERPYSGPNLIRQRGPEPKHITRVDVRFHVRGRAKFLNVFASNVTGEFTFDAWRNRYNTLEVDIRQARLYGGEAIASGEIVFPEDGGLPHYQVVVSAENVQTQGFLSDLTGSPQEFTGIFDGIGEWGGTIGDYRDWEGVGEFSIRESFFIGSQALVLLSRALEFGSEDRRTPSTIVGSARMANERVEFDNTVIENRRVRMVADGHVGFDDTINFLVTVDVLTNRLRNIPLVGRVVGVINTLKDSLVSFRVSGTIAEPEVSAAPLQLDKLPLFEAGTQLFGTAESQVGDRLRRAEQRLPRLTLPGVSGTQAGTTGTTSSLRDGARARPEEPTRDSTSEERSGR